ncbi:hypothetical protein HYV89_02510 [Candidatus Woesearchaeota archaeon]|nr:hypothetical protein [Candidatus Woesearchaeota archaeon]
MEDIFKISKDKRRAKDLYFMAKERLEEIIPVLPKDKFYKLIEEYYEVIVQLITSLMYNEGYKTLSHVGLIGYLSKNHPEFERGEMILIDSLRKMRHGTVYYGRRAEKEFLINHEETIRKIINKLIVIMKKKLQ